ncbi:MAG: DNA-3-methyladenine glycosylase I [Myxococcales bacterium]|nr:DNA-3-methyladenine glycosylase I [Myxococcales bacterium]
MDETTHEKKTPLPAGLVRGQDGHARCFWGDAAPGFAHYHDTEWGFPVEDEHKLFEKVCLEGFQSGLSWRTVLDKRPAFREVFLDFDFEKVARFDETDIERLVQDARIIRHRGKITATINNAQKACDAVDTYGSLGALLWRYEPPPERRPARMTHDVMRQISKTEDSIRLAKDLKKMGWKFFGPTTAYAFMQAMGLVNDHIEGCLVREQCEAARAAFVRPG